MPFGRVLPRGTAQRYCLTVAYDGSRFCGWQSQRGGSALPRLVQTSAASLSMADGHTPIRRRKRPWRASSLQSGGHEILALGGIMRSSTGRIAVQDALELAAACFVGSDNASRIVGSSRTDTGVHSVQSSCHLDISRTLHHREEGPCPPHPAETVRNALNGKLHAIGYGGELQRNAPAAVTAT